MFANSDIGANLTDGMYKGLYNGSKRHEPDLPFVLKRAWEAGLKHIVITGGQPGGKQRRVGTGEVRWYLETSDHWNIKIVG